MKLRRLTRCVSRHYDAHMAECGLKTTQYTLLVSIDRFGPIQPGELARHLSTDPSTITRNLQPLVDAGWARVDAGPDARSRLVGLTDAGRAKRAEAGALWKRAQLTLNRALGEARVARLHALIDDCQTELDRLEAGEASTR